MSDLAKRQQRKSNILLQGSILAVAGIIVRIIGVAKRIPLTEIITDTGNSYYSVAYELYTMILLISSYSLPLAVSKMVSARNSKGQHRNSYRVFKATLILACIVGGISAALVFVFAKSIANWTSEPLSYMALMVLAPTLLIVAIMGVFRGYFQGMGTMIPTAISQILEQIFVVAGSLLAAYYLSIYGDKVATLLQNSNIQYAYGAAGGAVGPGIGALIGLAFLYFTFMMFRKKFGKKIRSDVSSQKESYQQILKIMFLTIFPVLLSTAVYNASNIIDQKIFHDMMIRLGLESVKSEYWGVYTGKYRVLINVPIAFANAMCASVIPAITYMMEKHDFSTVRQKTSSVIRFVMMISIPCGVGMALVARPLIELLFNYEIDMAVSMMYVGSAAIVLYSLSTLTNGILQGIGKLHIPVRNAIVSLIVHVIALYLLMQYTNSTIYAVIYANLLFAFMMCILNAWGIRRHLKYPQEIKKTFLIPIIAAAAMGAMLLIANRFLLPLVGNLIYLCLAIPIAALLYFIILMLLGGVSRKDMDEIPGGRILKKLANLLHI